MEVEDKHNNELKAFEGCGGMSKELCAIVTDFVRRCSTALVIQHGDLQGQPDLARSPEKRESVPAWPSSRAARPS